VFDACLAGRGLEGWEAKLPTWEAGEKVATRKASGAVLAAILDVVPGLVGGGADLTGNTGTTIGAEGVQSADEPGGRQIYFGVREHGMAAAMNGMAMHGGTIPGRRHLPRLQRLHAARRPARVDHRGPRRLQLDARLGGPGRGRADPPADRADRLPAGPAGPARRAPRRRQRDGHRLARRHRRRRPRRAGAQPAGPPRLEGTAGNEGVLRGAYTLVAGGGDDPDLILIGTGSEVHTCVEAAALLEDEGIATRVVSMPSWELFAEQDDDYQDDVLVPDAPTLAVEAGRRSAGTAGPTTWWPSTASGCRRPVPRRSHGWGYDPEDVAERARALLADLLED
jgi:transketolase